MTNLSIRILSAWLMNAVLLVGSCLICLTPQAKGSSHDCCRAAVTKGHCDQPAPSKEPSKESKDCPNEKLFLETAKKQDGAAWILFDLNPDFIASTPAGLQEGTRLAAVIRTPRPAPFPLAPVLRI